MTPIMPVRTGVGYSSTALVVTVQRRSSVGQDSGKSRLAAAGEAVVGGIGADLGFEGAEIRGVVDEGQQFGAGDAGVMRKGGGDQGFPGWP